MAARRCSICAVCYSLSIHVCPTCGNTTWHSPEDEPDVDGGVPAIQTYDPRIHADKDATDATDETEYASATDARVYAPGVDAQIVDWRLLCFLRLGFNELSATALAVRRDINRVDVARLIGAGATPAQVRSILL